MFDCHIEVGEAEWIDERDEIVISETIKDIVIEDKLNVLEYNICGDHVHLLLVCEEKEVAEIVGKLKSVSSKNRNRRRGYTVAGTVTAIATGTVTRGHAPLSGSATDTATGGGADSSAPVRGTTSYFMIFFITC